MEAQQKIKLSSDFIVVRLVITAIIIFFWASVHNKADAINFKADLEHKLFLILFLGFLIYFSTRPNIYYDSKDLYIKRIGTKEISIPLEDIRSITKIYLPRWRSDYRIRYLVNKELESVSLTESSFSQPMAEFIGLVKRINPALVI